ncbi:MAG: MmgE/PrpD family protein, partial [Pseudomonadota bacterium]
LAIFGHSHESGVKLAFDGRTVTKAGAAFAGASQVDNLDAHDGFNPAKGHIAAALVPSLFALGWDQQNQLSGKAFLRLLAIGYEIASRAGLAIHASCDDYHTSGAWNTLGVVAAGGRLNGLDHTSLRHAFGIAEYHAPRSQMMREIAFPSMLHDGSAFGALSAVMALDMAERGFQGAPSLLIEGRQSAVFWRDLGQRWYSLEQYIKPYPICRWAHAPIDGALMLRKQYGFSPGDIKKVLVSTFDEGVALLQTQPGSCARAQYSISFPIACALVHGNVDVRHITGSGLVDPAVLALMEQIDIAPSPRHNARFPEGRWADIAVILQDGTRLHSGDLNARGGPDHPLDDDEIIEKFYRFATTLLSQNRARKLHDLVLALDQDKAAFGQLCVELTKPVS